MSEDNNEERTEQPTEKRIREAREKGMIAHSRELSVFVMLFFGVSYFAVFWHSIYTQISQLTIHIFSIPRADLYENNTMFVYLLYALKHGFSYIIPFFFLMILSALIGHTIIGGFNFNIALLEFNFGKLDPLSGLGRMFSMRNVVDTIKSIVKILILLAILIAFFRHYQNEFVRLTLVPSAIGMNISSAIKLFVIATFLLMSGMLIPVLIDVGYQIWHNFKTLKMTKQELKDEYKDAEGNVEIKQRIRRMQEEISKRKMLKEVPLADVVIVNPTHFSVALRYSQGRDNAPILVAKGVDYMALHIQKIAKAHHVEIFSAPPLARSLYHTTKLNAEIPYGLYLAVAKILAYVFQIKRYKQGKGKKPQEVNSIDIPEDMQY